jgi:isocitrate lyase
VHPIPIDPAARIQEEAERLAADWEADERWQGIRRPYGPEEVVRLRGSLRVEHSLARLGAERLWRLLTTEDYVAALGALSGGQAVQMVKAGLKAIYLSGWQVAADANLSGHTYPDQSLYPSNSAPALVRRLNNALQRADQIAWAEGDGSIDWLAPIVADAEAGFGGPLHAFELMKSMIEAGAAGVHFEDQLASEKKCGHLGGKVLVPTSQFVRTLVGARLASDVLGVPTVLVSRTDALSATLLTSDADPADAEFLTGERTAEGFHRVRDGLEPAIARSLAYAPYADVIWFETGASTCRTVRSRRSSRSSARWATASSSSRSPASTRSTSRCSSLRAATRRAACRPTSSSRSASSRSRSTATPRRGTSARSAPGTSTASSMRSPEARAPRSR